jgi:hypothetical protein
MNDVNPVGITLHTPLYTTKRHRLQPVSKIILYFLFMFCFVDSFTGSVPEFLSTAAVSLNYPHDIETTNDRLLKMLRIQPAAAIRGCRKSSAAQRLRFP